MEKTCNSRKNLVTGYSHGWSLIIIRLSIRILQVTFFFFFPNRKKVGKIEFLSIFLGEVHCTNKKPSFCVKGKGRLFSLLMRGQHEQQQAAVAVLTPCLTAAVMNVVCQFWGLHSWQPRLQLWLLHKAQWRSQSATSRFQVTVVQKASLQQYMHFTPSCSFCQAVIFN